MPFCMVVMAQACMPRRVRRFAGVFPGAVVAEHRFNVFSSCQVLPVRLQGNSSLFGAQQLQHSESVSG